MWRKLLISLACLSTAVPATLLADCNGDPCVLVYRGALTQSLAQSPDGTWVKEVELADVNEDGWLDLFLLQKQPLVEMGSSLQIRPRNNLDLIYLNRGVALGGLNFELDAPLSGAFQLKSDAFPTSFETTRGYDAEFVDLDGDQHLDIIRPDTPGILKVLWGDGTGKFASVTDVLADIGGDPNATCTVSFIPPDINSGGNYDDVSVGDCGNDGDADFVVAQYSTCGENFIIENDGSGNFSFVSRLPALDAKRTHSVSFGNANPGANGNLDLLLDHGSGFNPEVYLGTSPDCTFQSSSRQTLPLSVNFLTTVGDIIDLTGDNLPDVFLAKGPDGGDYGLYKNTGNTGTPYGGITRIPGCPGGAGCPDAGKYDVRYGDIDGDGRMEAVTANINVGENCCFDGNGDCQDCGPGPAGASSILDTALQVMRFAASGSITNVTSEFVDSTYTGNLGGIAVAFGDLDLDGDADVVLGGVVDQATPDPNDVNVFGAAHVWENRTLTQLEGRTVSSGQLDLLALKTLTAGNGAILTGSAKVTFEAGEEIVLEGGFTASPGSGGQFVARILP